MKTTAITRACKSIDTRSGRFEARGIYAHPWAQAMLDVLQRRGRSYGLLAHYEESRLNSLRQ